MRELYTQGLIVNLLNPKTIVFIFAFIPQFVDVNAGHVWLQILLLGLTLAGLGFASDSLYAVVAGTVADRLRGTPLIARIERWFGGTVLIGLGRCRGDRRAAPLELVGPPALEHLGVLRRAEHRSRVTRRRPAPPSKFRVSLAGNADRVPLLQLDDLVRPPSAGRCR